MGSEIYLALSHYPVVNKQGDRITSAVTTIDLHDIARAACTFGARRLYVVTPLVDQQALVARVTEHWTAGVGGAYNPSRRQALERVAVVTDLQAAADDAAARSGARPRTIATSARRQPGAVGYATARRMLADGRPSMLIFGTAWGLAPETLSGADLVLEPVNGTGDYNHLSVRSAAAIILDRLAGRRDESETC